MYLRLSTPVTHWRSGQRKLTAHLHACRSSGFHFLPIVAEALGGLGQDTISLVRSLGKSIAQQAFLPGGYNPNISALPQTCHRPWEGECLPLATSPPTPPPLCGWDHLNLPPSLGRKYILNLKKTHSSLLLYFMCVVIHY